MVHLIDPLITGLADVRREVEAEQAARIRRQRNAAMNRHFRLGIPARPLARPAPAVVALTPPCQRAEVPTPSALPPSGPAVRKRRAPPFSPPVSQAAPFWERPRCQWQVGVRMRFKKSGERSPVFLEKEKNHNLPLSCREGWKIYGNWLCMQWKRRWVVSKVYLCVSCLIILN